MARGGAGRLRMGAAERRERTLDLATGLFARRGFAGTRTSELAAACGVSEGMLFKLFGSKRGLYRALIARKLARAGEAVFPRQAARAGDDEAFFRTVLGELLSNMRRDPDFVRLLLYSALEGGDLSRMFHRVRSGKVLGFVAAYVRRRTREGAFRAVDADLAALGCLGMVFQYVIATQVFGMGRYRRADAGKVAAEFSRIALGGVRR